MGQRERELNLRSWAHKADAPVTSGHPIPPSRYCHSSFNSNNSKVRSATRRERRAGRARAYTLFSLPLGETTRDEKGVGRYYSLAL